jgi:nucleotide-binding universal stress UspA family protein
MPEEEIIEFAKALCEQEKHCGCHKQEEKCEHVWKRTGMQRNTGMGKMCVWECEKCHEYYLADEGIEPEQPKEKCCCEPMVGNVAKTCHHCPIHGERDYYSKDEYDKSAMAYGTREVEAVQARAKAASVPSHALVRLDPSPWEAIIRTAREEGCDLIFMASHGRRGMAGLLLGSETQKVLTHCKIPVLVHR